MYFKKPSLNSIRNVHFHPFKTKAWGYYFLTWFILGLFLAAVQYKSCQTLSIPAWWIVSFMTGKSKETKFLENVFNSWSVKKCFKL